MKFKKLSENAKTPTLADQGAAGYDLYAAEAVTVRSGEVAKISTDIAIELERFWFAAVCSRSGLASKGIWVANAPGIVDPSYRGSIGVLIYNSTSEPFVVKVGDRIAQLVIQPYLTVEWEEVENLTTTERGAAGFGSSGK
jgi:dUTP pyrophosphatase